MAGTSEGGKKAHRTTVKKLGRKYIRERNARAGSVGRTGGFAANPELASQAAKKSWENRRRRAAEEAGSTD